MKNPTLWIVIVIVIILGLGWWWYSTSQTPAPSSPAAEVEENEFSDNSKDGAPAVSAFTVRYTDSGFSPSTLTVAVGTTVTFVNQSGEGMWVAADEHPSHTGYDGTSRSEHCPNSGTVFDQCANSSTYSFTFTKAGTWVYHNHLGSSDKGTIVVTP